MNTIEHLLPLSAAQSFAGPAKVTDELGKTWSYQFFRILAANGRIAGEVGYGTSQCGLGIEDLEQAKALLAHVIRASNAFDDVVLQLRIARAALANHRLATPAELSDMDAALKRAEA